MHRPEAVERTRRGAARAIKIAGVMPAARYFDLIREMENPYNHRLRLVGSAQRRGIKPTARPLNYSYVPDSN